VRNRPNYVEQVRSVLSGQLPGCPPALLDLYTLLALQYGTATDAVMVHNAWSVWCNNANPTHCSLIPFPYLAPDVQALDEPYVQAIHQATRTVLDQHVSGARPNRPDGAA
jgi:hypothetical protein